MAAGGYLTNTHIRLGDSFLETVCPTDLAWKRSSTQTRLLERNGDCGYMAIVQVPDISVASRSMASQGAGRGIVAGDWNVCPGCVNVQFHPRDFGTLAEIQENWPGHGDFPGNKGAYFPAGNTWQNGVDGRPHGGVTTGFAAVEIALRDGDPEEVCTRWMNGLGAGCSIDTKQSATLCLSGGQTMRFVQPEPGGRTGVVGVDLWAAPGTQKKFESMEICGVKWTLVDHADPLT